MEVVTHENEGTGTENSPWLEVVDAVKDVDFAAGGTEAGAKEEAFPPPLAPNENTLPPLEDAVVADERCCCCREDAIVGVVVENSDVGAAVLPEATAAAAQDEATGMNEVAVENG